MNRYPLMALVALAAIASIPAATFAQQVRLRIGHDQPTGTMYDEGHTIVSQAGRGTLRRAHQSGRLSGSPARL
jgi:hypothetical protein